MSAESRPLGDAGTRFLIGAACLVVVIAGAARGGDRCPAVPGCGVFGGCERTAHAMARTP